MPAELRYLSLLLMTISVGGYGETCTPSDGGVRCLGYEQLCAEIHLTPPCHKSRCVCNSGYSGNEEHQCSAKRELQLGEKCQPGSLAARCPRGAKCAPLPQQSQLQEQEYECICRTKYIVSEDEELVELDEFEPVTGECTAPSIAGYCSEAAGDRCDAGRGLLCRGQRCECRPAMIWEQELDSCRYIVYADQCRDDVDCSAGVIYRMQQHGPLKPKGLGLKGFECQKKAGEHVGVCGCKPGYSNHTIKFFIFEEATGDLDEHDTNICLQTDKVTHLQVGEHCHENVYLDKLVNPTEEVALCPPHAACFSCPHEKFDDLAKCRVNGANSACLGTTLPAFLLLSHFFTLAQFRAQ